MGRRDQDVHFLASKEEVQRIHEKMDELGIRSMGAYLRKMALDGYCINLDLQDVKELVSLLRRCSNNLNQYAIPLTLCHSYRSGSRFFEAAGLWAGSSCLSLSRTEGRDGCSFSP